MRFRLLPTPVHQLLVLIMVGVLLAACSPVSKMPASPEKKAPVPTTSAAALFHTVLKTADGKFLIQFTITPNRFGVNLFLLNLKDARSGTVVTNEQAQLFTTMLDMQMATGVILLQPDGKGGYSARGSLAMDGNWDIHIQLVDDDGVHIAKLRVFTPS